MHDPMVVVFDVHLPVPHGSHWPKSLDGKRWSLRRRRRTNPENLGEPVYPWWRPMGYVLFAAGRSLRWLHFATVWHIEPKGHDSGTVCKGMGGSDFTWQNVRWAWKHRAHLQINVEPYLRIKRWLTCRCAECGYRFFWKQARCGYMSGDEVYHERCMSLRHARGQLNDAASALDFTADQTARWRVERWLAQREEVGQ